LIIKTILKAVYGIWYTVLMPLFRRHLKTCRVHTLKLPTRAVRYWNECRCPIWLSGRVGNVIYDRHSLDLIDWKEAVAHVAALEAQGKSVTVHGERLQVCIDLFLASHGLVVTPKVLGQHDLLLRRLRDYCTARGLYFVRELSADVLERFKVELPETASKYNMVAKLKTFLRHAFRVGWITENLADRVMSVTTQYAPGDPFEEDEIVRLLDGVTGLRPAREGYARLPGTFRLMMEFALTTGLRAGDCVRYDPRRCTKGEQLWIYSFEPQKQRSTRRKRTVEAFLPESLKLAIDKAEWFSEKLPFSYGEFEDPHYLASMMRLVMREIGKNVGVAKARPHRLRDSFAVRNLLAGMSIDDLSHLLHHSSPAVTLAHYAKWTSGRARRLESIRARTLIDS